jgi:twitching motility protein PilT
MAPQNPQIKETQILEILVEGFNKEASDVLIKVDRPPILKVNGTLERLTDYGVLKVSDVENIAKNILGETRAAELNLGTTDIDCSYQFPDSEKKLHRVRANISHDSCGLYITMRVIPDEIRRIEEIGFPYDSVWQDICGLKSGLVFIGGPTGSGKSTTMAAIIQKINETRKEHIITIEDPIEYAHFDKKSTISQREIGYQLKTFHDGLKYALRQAPNVIMVGEIRDRQTAEMVLEASSTGHLVITTIHTDTADHAPARFVEMFKEEEQKKVRNMLAANLSYVIVQQLIPPGDSPDKILLMEILKARGDTQVQALIRTGKDEQLMSAIQTGQEKGMISMNMHLKSYVNARLLDPVDALNYTTRPDELATELGLERNSNRLLR